MSAALLLNLTVVPRNDCRNITQPVTLFRSDPDTGKMVFCNGMVLHKTQCMQSFGNWIESIVEFSQNLHRMKLDISSFSCLTALVLITGEYAFYILMFKRTAYYIRSYIIQCIT